MDFFTVALVAIFLLLIYKFGTRNFDHWTKKGVDFIPPVPFAGSLWPVISIQEHMAEYFGRRAEEHKGKRYVGYFQGSTPGLLVMDPDLIKTMVISDFSYFVDHGFQIDPDNDPMQSRNLFNMDGQPWRDMRNKLSPTFTSGRIKAMYPLVEECAKNFENYMREHQRQEINIKDLLARFTTDVIGSCAFGLPVNSVKNPEDKFREMGRKLFDVDLIQGIKNGCIFFLPTVAKLFRFSFFSQELSIFFRALVKDIIGQRTSMGNTRKDFMQLLIQLKEKGTLGNIEGEPAEKSETPASSIHKLTEDDIVAQAVVFFIAGFETSSSVLSYALMEIARYPEVQQKARENIEEVLQRHDGTMSYQALKEMTYLDNIFQEALRMYPSLPILNRVCTKNYTIPGTKVSLEKGTLVVIPTKALQNDPEYFEDPNTFNPDRFNDENLLKKRLVYMPFGDGPRQCIGMRFAKMQSKLGLYSILRYFEVLESTKTVYPPVWDPKQFLLAAKDDIFIRLKGV